ncbi:MAG: ATP-binding protein [Nannocystaceae bacterium]
MRIALKLTLALVGVIVALLAAEAWLRGLREAAVYEEDIRRNQRILGRALEQSAEITWREQGLEHAAYLLEAAGAREREVAVRVTDEATALRGADDDAVHRWERDGTIQVSEPRVLRTYLRIDGPSGQRRALALSTSLRGEGAHVREALVEFAVIALALLVAAAIASLWLGRALVGRRVDQLVARARSIGAGDFSERPPDHGRDELSQLATALEDMARALSAARQALEDETHARIAATAHLRRSDRLATVGTLAAGLAHELGTPLHVISGRARMIARAAEASADLRDDAAAIVDQSARVQRIIEDLLDFARPRPAERRPLDVGALLHTDLELLGPLLRRTGATWTIERVAGAPARLLYGDVDQLRQVFTNLVLNAAQAMPDGGTIALEIAGGQPAPPELVTEEPEAADRDFTRITVRDHGHGIDPKALPRLFDPFFTTKEVGEGSGLGLAVAHGIVNDHGGWIAAESDVGRGSAFHVWLPEMPEPRDTEAPQGERGGEG